LTGSPQGKESYIDIIDRSTGKSPSALSFTCRKITLQDTESWINADFARNDGTGLRQWVLIEK
jgi:hypothetical protein